MNVNLQTPKKQSGLFKAHDKFLYNMENTVDWDLYCLYNMNKYIINKRYSINSIGIFGFIYFPVHSKVMTMRKRVLQNRKTDTYHISEREVINMKKRIVSVIVCLIMVVVLTVGSTVSAMAEFRVTQIQTGKKGAALRSSPAGEKIAGVHQYTYLDVLDQQNGWFYVYYNGQYGWVTSDSSFVTITRTEDVDTSTSYPSSSGPYPSSSSSYYSSGSLDPYDMGIPYIGNTVFRENMMNMVVFWVQTQLKATGVWYQGYQWDVTGNLGDHTMSEIRSFMQARGYRGHTGVINQEVIDAIADYMGDRLEPVMIGGFYDSMNSITTRDSYGTMYQIVSNLRDMVARTTNGARWVQCVLQGIGYYSGAIDGMYGEKTEEAVKRFQRDNGFQERDYVSLGVARAMLEQFYWRGGNVNMLP